MYIINVNKNMVFSYISDGEDVFAMDYENESIVNLSYEIVSDIQKMIKKEIYIFFILEKEENSHEKY